MWRRRTILCQSIALLCEVPPVNIPFVGITEMAKPSGGNLAYPAFQNSASRAYHLLCLPCFWPSSFYAAQQEPPLFTSRTAFHLTSRTRTTQGFFSSSHFISGRRSTEPIQPTISTSQPMVMSLVLQPTSHIQAGTILLGWIPIILWGRL